MSEIHVNDEGSVLRVKVLEDGVAKDISAATVMKIKLEKPDGTDLTKTAVFTNAGVDGLMQYVTEANVLSDPGRWRIQGYIEIAGGKFHTDAEEFIVKENLS